VFDFFFFELCTKELAKSNRNGLFKSSWTAADSKHWRIIAGNEKLPAVWSSPQEQGKAQASQENKSQDSQRICTDAS
jgi:hypothetical protein